MEQAIQNFRERFSNDLQNLLPLTKDEAETIASQLDEFELFLISDTLAFLEAVNELDVVIEEGNREGKRVQRIKVFSMLFILEAFANVIYGDDGYGNEKLQKLFRDHLSEADKRKLLIGFRFSEIFMPPTQEPTPAFHVMAKTVDDDDDFLKAALWVNGKIEEIPEARRAEFQERQQVALQEYRDRRNLKKKFTDPVSGQEVEMAMGCSVDCLCETWLARQDVGKIDKELDIFARNLYLMRNSVAHHAFPIFFVAERGTMADVFVWRSKSGRWSAMRYEVIVTLEELVDAFENCLASALRGRII